MHGPFLRVEKLRKDFGGVKAVDEVSFSVAQGEIFGIIGPNGAGKTTLFNLLTGLTPASGGRAQFRGQEILALRPHEITAIGIARTFQNIRLFGKMSLLDNILIARHCRLKSNSLHSILRTKSEQEEERQAIGKSLEWLARFGLQKKWDMKAGALAYGEQRLVEIARALATGAKLVFLDEPASGMNSAESERLMRYVQDIRESGVTPVLIEHHMDVVMNLCDRIMVLDQGHVIAQGAPELVRKDIRVIEAYLGREADPGA